MKHLLFVYGSLMKGCGNHRQLEGSRFVRNVRTIGKLYDLGAFPALLLEGDGYVRGELYEVDDETLSRLDRFEGCPNMYRRVAVRVQSSLSEDTSLYERAWTYVYQRAVKPESLVRSGYWRARGNEAVTIETHDGRKFFGTPLEIVNKMKSRVLFRPDDDVRTFVEHAISRGDELGFTVLNVDLDGNEEAIARQFVHELIRTGMVR